MKNSGSEIGKSDSTRSESSSIEFISEGQLCPNCRFVRLRKEPGNIIRCPICGFGNGAGCT